MISIDQSIKLAIDPYLVSDDEITYAIRLLLSLSDNQIRRHILQFQDLTKKVTAVTKSDSLSAETITNTAQSNLELVREFLLKDQTGVILRSAHDLGKDPRTAVLLLRTGDRERLLACRYLALCRRQHFPDDMEIVKGGGRQRSRSKREGNGRAFINAIGLPLKNQTEDGLKRGEKVLQIEDDTGNPGVSFALLPSFVKLDHLYSNEIRRVPAVFASQPLVSGMVQASRWSQLLDFYQTLYNYHVGEYPVFRLFQLTQHYAFKIHYT
ncbi:uncharacterized protein KD926_007720 [Aspergillus affinis]|uniref:uncharacterized protein n=1 Tax=Aspergillus affinis TaxID=1070780 RepID=UPI0022FE3847|nr:uncharacterized protein KD926_007720 [Aspergillus affinis]KAI9040776.1 hypothetical protein KD926_007720 [Aspergillus affinis]